MRTPISKELTRKENPSSLFPHPLTKMNLFQSLERQDPRAFEYDDVRGVLAVCEISIQANS